MLNDELIRQLISAIASTSGSQSEDFRLRFLDSSPVAHVVDGGRGVMAHSVGRTVSLTNDVFSSGAELDVTIRITLSRGAVAVGIVSSNIDEAACRSHLLGEGGAPLSIACLVCRGECLVVCGDNIHHRAIHDSPQDPTDVNVTLKEGIVGFSVDGHSLNCAFLKGPIASGTYRLATSVVGVGARSVIHRVSTIGDGVSLADCCRSTGIRDEGRTIFCRTTRRATNYSRQTYVLENLDACFVCTIRQRMSGYVFMGILPATATMEAPNFNCGDPGIASSISCGIRDGEVVLMKDGNLFFVAQCESAEPVEIRMTIRRGSLAFAVGEFPLKAHELEDATFNGSVRIGVSLTVEGQEATIHRAW